MPAAQLKSLSKKTGVGVKTLERYWDQAKKQASKKFDKHDDHYWAYVSSITSNRAIIKRIKKD